MSKLKTSATLLLLSTALWSTPSFAQAAGTIDQANTEQPVNNQDAQNDVDISAPGAGGFGNEIIVQGRFIPNEIRNTASVISVLSTEDIARSGDGDIASALERVTGLSVDSGGFVYVRGLGDRYSQALLNGSPLPSPEPLKRVVPLDIFPTNIVASAVVQKSYSVNYPGEFGGGVINLTTPVLPDESFFTIGYGIGANTETTGKLGYTHFGSDSDFTGFDDGTRDIPVGLAAAIASGNRIEFGNNFTENDLQGLAASLLNAPITVVQRNDNIPVNMSADLSAGYIADIGSSRLGLIANIGYDNNWSTRDSIQQSGTRSQIVDDARTVRTDNNIVVSGLVSAGLEFGEHKVRWTNLYIRDTLKQTRLSAGDNINFGNIDPATPADAITQRTNWVERQLIDTQMVGEFDFGDFSVDLRGGYANSQREAPYESQFVYAYDAVAQDYVNNLQTNPQSATLVFSDLNEDIWSGGIDLAYEVPGTSNLVLSAGYAYSDTTRDATRRDFRYTPINSIPFPVSQERPDFLISDFNIFGGYTPDILTDGIYIQESNTLPGSQAYDASLEIHGAYLKVEAELLPFVTIEAGVRYEDAKQQVTALDIYNDGTIVQTPALNNDYWLPAATLTWNFAEDMQLRLNASKTIARPQFRELARPLYLDTDSNRSFRGNPFLVDSELFNAEARYEWFFGRGERFTAAAFYKKIDNPIEPFSFLAAGSSSYVTTFFNAPEAELYGAEFELVKYVPLDTLSTSDFFASRRLVAIANYTYTQSSLNISANDTVNSGLLGLGEVAATRAFTDGSTLTGQSKHLVNLQLGIEDTDTLSQFTFLMRHASDRVSQRGQITNSIPDPDFIEEPGLTLDFVARQDVALMSQPFSLKFEARNITSQKYRESQSGDVVIVTDAYDIGTSFKFSISTTF